MKGGITLFEFKCFHIVDYIDEWIPKRYIAETSGKAKYQHARYLHNELNYGDDIWDMLKDMKVKKVGCASISYFFNDNDTWERVKKWRNLDFAYLGMEVDVCGKKGIIVGGNSGLNLQVVFDFDKGKPWIDNCHPWYETTYFDRDENIVADYKQRKD
jgi:hypothetical protein